MDRNREDPPKVRCTPPPIYIAGSRRAPAHRTPSRLRILFARRLAVCCAQNQLGFFEFIVLPFYTTVSKVAPELGFLFKLANDNYKCWKDLQAKGVVKLKDCTQVFAGRRGGGGKRTASGI